MYTCLKSISLKGFIMAGVQFSFVDFSSLIQLSMGIADRLDENRVESFSILYCNFSMIDTKMVQNSLEQVLRNSDAVVHYDHHYFFVLPYTDSYGSKKVKEMFDEYFDTKLDSSVIAYPKHGETASELLGALQIKADNKSGNKLDFLDALSS